MRHRTKFIAIAIVFVVVLRTVVLLSTLRHGLSAHDEPTRLEALAARSMRHWAAPADLRNAKNPLPLTPAVLTEARAHWADHCASCHGNDGKGKTTIGLHLYPRAPDMSLPDTQELSDGELFSVIENGIRLTGMPGWGEGTGASGYGSWALVHLIRRLPDITQEELDEMERLNPKAPEEWEQQMQEEMFLNGESADAEPAAATTSSHEHH